MCRPGCSPMAVRDGQPLPHVVKHGGHRSRKDPRDGQALVRPQHCRLALCTVRGFCTMPGGQVGRSMSARALRGSDCLIWLRADRHARGAACRLPVCCTESVVRVLYTSLLASAVWTLAARCVSLERVRTSAAARATRSVWWLRGSLGVCASRSCVCVTRACVLQTPGSHCELRTCRR